MKIEVELDHPRVRPGDWVSGAVHVLEGGGARSVQVFLAYWERTQDYSIAAVRIVSEVHQGDLLDGAALPFALAVPGHAQPAVRGQHGWLEWGVSAQVDRFGSDEHAYMPLEVSLTAPAAVDLPASVREAAGAGDPPSPGRGAPPGWYADPHGAARLRWYDGIAWTDRTAS